jgi:cytochrome c
MINNEAISVKRLCLTLAILLLVTMVFGPAPGSFAREKPAFRVLVFTKTAAFRHDSIPDAIAAFRKLGAENRFEADFTEESQAFNDANLAKYDAVVFLLTTGDVLNEAQQAAFERYIRTGHGYVGVHSASDTEYDWPFYGELVGAYFKNHPTDPQIQKAVIRVEDSTHPSTSFLPNPWVRSDEWYNFRSNPRGKAHILLNLDESTYVEGEMGADHPIAWCRNYSGGRSWYTGGGHTKESYSEPLFMRHILGGIQWAAGVKGGRCETAK